MCSSWTIKSDNFIGRQNRPIFAQQTTDFCWPILLADKISQLHRSSDIPFIIKHRTTYTVWNPHDLCCGIRMVKRVPRDKVGRIFIQRYDLHLQTLHTQDVHVSQYMLLGGSVVRALDSGSRGHDSWVRLLVAAFLSNKVNSAFHPSGLGKSSTSLHGWG